MVLPARAAARSPSVRAHYMQTFAREIERLPPRDRDAIRKTVPEETWASIESAGLLGWLPLSVNLSITRAVSSALGRERAHVFFRQLLLGAAHTPLLRGLVQSVLRVAVRDPGLYLPWISKGFELMFRDSGRWTVLERDLGSASIEVKGLPAACFADRLWVESVASSLCALLDLAQLTGDVALSEVDERTGRVVFRGTWTPR
jgi:hypothetical protein